MKSCGTDMFCFKIKILNWIILHFEIWEREFKIGLLFCCVDCVRCPSFHFSEETK